MHSVPHPALPQRDFLHLAAAPPPSSSSSSCCCSGYSSIRTHHTQRQITAAACRWPCGPDTLEQLMPALAHRTALCYPCVQQPVGVILKAALIRHGHMACTLRHASSRKAERCAALGGVVVGGAPCFIIPNLPHCPNTTAAVKGCMFKACAASDRLSALCCLCSLLLRGACACLCGLLAS